jgi:hypothetical protein
MNDRVEIIDRKALEQQLAGMQQRVFLTGDLFKDSHLSGSGIT